LVKKRGLILRRRPLALFEKKVNRQKMLQLFNYFFIQIQQFFDGIEKL